jgi:hypothetical protein
MKQVIWVKGAAVITVAGFMGAIGCAQQPAQVASSAVPRYQVDPFWPRNEHGIHVDWQGNIYTAEVGSGRRLQKFKPIVNPL